MAKISGSKTKNPSKRAKANKTSKKGRKTESLEVKIEKIKSGLISIRDRFETGKVERLKSLEHLFTTAMAQELGVNHSRFVTKLYNPITFSFREVYRFANYVGFDPQLMISQIAKEIRTNHRLEEDLTTFKSIKDIKGYNKG